MDSVKFRLLVTHDGFRDGVRRILNLWRTYRAAPGQGGGSCEDRALKASGHDFIKFGLCGLRQRFVHRFSLLQARVGQPASSYGRSAKGEPGGLCRRRWARRYR